MYFHGVRSWGKGIRMFPRARERDTTVCARWLSFVLERGFTYLKGSLDLQECPEKNTHNKSKLFQREWNFLDRRRFLARSTIH